MIKIDQIRDWFKLVSLAFWRWTVLTYYQNLYKDVKETNNEKVYRKQPEKLDNRLVTLFHHVSKEKTTAYDL